MAWAYQGRGTAYMYKGEMTQALQDFNRVVELQPKLVWAYFNRGLIWVYLGDEVQGQKDFDECLRLRPDLKGQLDPRIDLARHLRRVGQPMQ
jgi:tetratricopeptide (TPR) repeat protein